MARAADPKAVPAVAAPIDDPTTVAAEASAAVTVAIGPPMVIDHASAAPPTDRPVTVDPVTVDPVTVDLVIVDLVIVDLVIVDLVIVDLVIVDPAIVVLAIEDPAGRADRKVSPARADSTLVSPGSSKNSMLS